MSPRTIASTIFSWLRCTRRPPSPRDPLSTPARDVLVVHHPRQHAHEERQTRFRRARRQYMQSCKRLLGISPVSMRVASRANSARRRSIPGSSIRPSRTLHSGDFDDVRASNNSACPAFREIQIEHRARTTAKRQPGHDEAPPGRGASSPTCGARNPRGSRKTARLTGTSGAALPPSRARRRPAICAQRWCARSAGHLLSQLWSGALLDGSRGHATIQYPKVSAQAGPDGNPFTRCKSR